MTQTTPEALSFDGLGIAPTLLQSLTDRGYTKPTPIQHQVIPIAIEGKDVIGIAQTGTGKTLAFGVPLLQRIAQDKVQGLILLPTRELALQAEEMIMKVGRSFGLKTAVLIGGASQSMQVRSLRLNPHIIIATPGRLYDHLQQKTCSLDKVKIIVLDEADRMLDIGFLPQIKQILKVAPVERQTLLFSATMPDAIAYIAKNYMKMPLRIEVAPAGTASDNVEQHVFFTLREDKPALLDKLLAEHTGPILVFSRTKHGAKKITRDLRITGHTAAEIHSNLSLNQRRQSLDGFKSGRYRVLVATDIAARGIDVKNISLVINYDLPDNHEDYVHRIGRTGRAGTTGKAVSFAAPSEWSDIQKIERLVRKKINIVNAPAVTPQPRDRRMVMADRANRPPRQRRRRPSRGGYAGSAPRNRGR